MKKIFNIICASALILASNYSNAQTYIWGAAAAVGTAEGEFQNPITQTSDPLVLSATSWNALAVSPSAYWARSLSSGSGYWESPSYGALGSNTPGNGLANFDCYNLNNGGGTYRQAALISPRIDLTGYTDLPIDVQFYSRHLPNSDTELSISVSVDDGLTWSAEIDYTFLQPHSGNIYDTPTTDLISIHFPSVTAGISNLSQCRVRFNFEGGGKWASIDDVTVWDNPCPMYINRLEDINACLNEYTSASGVTYNTLGEHTENQTTLCGNDSITVINILSFGGGDYNVQTTNSCDSLTWDQTGTTYTQNGVYEDAYQNITGCDSIYTLDLTINNSISDTSFITICESYEWPANNQIYDESGFYKLEMQSIHGCDSTVSLDLVINTSYAAINSSNSPDLVADSNSDSYQWVNCLDNYSVIPGATDPNFTSDTTGIFALITSSDGCDSDTSSCFQIDFAAITKFDLESQVSTAPNPSNNGIIYVQSDQPISDLRMFSMMGSEIDVDISITDGRIDGSSLHSGSYLVFISIEDQFITKKVLITK